MANRRASLAWKDVLDADTSATFISADAAVNHTRAASGWEARRSVVLTPSAVRGSLIHTIARRDAAPKGYLGEPITPASARSPSSAISDDRKPSIDEEDEDDANDDVVEEDTPVADSARPRATSDAFLPTPVKAGAVFPVRPNPLLLDPTSSRHLLHPSMSPTHHHPPPESASASKEKVAKESKEADSHQRQQHEEQEEIPDESLRQLPQVITSFLHKQGKARKKWSKRYFTLLPQKQQLIYTHQKKAKDKEGKKIKGTNVMSIESVHVDGHLNSIHEEGDGIASHLTSEHAHDITMLHASQAANGYGLAEAPVANPAGGKMNITVISLKKFRLESMEDLIDNGHINPQQLSQLKQEGEKQFCIIVPADSTTEETNKGNKGSPHKDAGKDSANADGTNGAAAESSSASEKRIELRTSSAVLYDEWILQFRRLTFLQTFLSTYHAIISRNKAHALQGHFELINDPTGGLGEEFAQQILTFIHDPAAASHLKKKPISEISLFTSFLTGDARRVCSKCQSAFGLTALEIICVDCQQSFCTRYTCSTPRSYTDEGVDTFSALQIKSFNQHKKEHDVQQAQSKAAAEGKDSSSTADSASSNAAAKPAHNHHQFPIKPPPPRLCLDCERKRQCDPIYQKLLNGQLNLCLRIVSATHIMPTSLMNKLSDPYVKFTVGKQEYRTSIISNTLNPIWEKDNEFNISWGDAASSSSAIAAEEDSGASLSGASNMVKGMKNFLVAFGKPLASLTGGGGSGGADSHDSFGGFNASGDALPKVLCLELFDHDPIGADTFMGCVYLPIFDFEKNVFYSDSFPLRPKKDGTGATTGSQSDALHNLKILGAPLAHKPRKITGALQLQVILTTSTYTADLIKLLPSFEGLTKRNSLMAAAVPLTPPQPTRSPLSSMRTSILTNIFGHHHHAHKDSTSSDSSHHLVIPSVAPSPVAKPSPKLTPLELEIQSFLRTSHLHNLLLKSMDIILAFQLSEIIDMVNEVFTYKDPFLSIFSWVFYSIFILYFPSEWILPLLPLLLLLHLVSNLMSSELKRGSDLIAALIAAEEARVEKAALDLAADMKAARKASSIHHQLKGHLKGFGDLFKRKHDHHHHDNHHQLAPSVSAPAAAMAATSPTAPATSSASAQNSPALSPTTEGQNSGTPQLSPLSDGSPGLSPQPDAHASLPPPATSASALTISTDSPALAPVATSPSTVPTVPDHPQRTPADDEHLDEEERSGSVVFRMRRLKRQVKSLQYLLDCVFDGLEELIRMYEWKNVEKAQRCVRGCIFTFLLTYYMSFRWLLILAGAYKWSRHLLKLRRRIISMQDYKHNINLVQAMKAASTVAHNKTKHKK